MVLRDSYTKTLPGVDEALTTKEIGFAVEIHCRAGGKSLRTFRMTEFVSGILAAVTNLFIFNLQALGINQCALS